MNNLKFYFLQFATSFVLVLLFFACKPELNEHTEFSELRNKINLMCQSHGITYDDLKIQDEGVFFLYLKNNEKEAWSKLERNISFIKYQKESEIKSAERQKFMDEVVKPQLKNAKTEAEIKELAKKYPNYIRL